MTGRPTSRRPTGVARSGPGTRERILAAAVTILAEGGPRELTQPRVAARAGIRQSLLTHHFPHRADLVEALANEFVGGVAAELESLAARSTRASLEALVQRLLALVADPTHMKVFAGLVLEAQADPAIRKVFEGTSRELARRVARLLGLSARGERLVLPLLWGLGFDVLVRGTARPRARGSDVLRCLRALEER